MPWFFLSLAILSEVFGSSMLKLSEGFSKPWPTAAMAVAFLCSFYFLSLSLKSIPLGTAYAVWAGVGLVLTCIISIVFFGQKADVAGIVGIGFILTGVLILNTLSGMVRH
ncbi:putative small multidrug resistance protein [Neisseria animaloris]|uniref:DMT family transporter n=1 Tax=Neisseria animaloris TaxID=326522 RepID=UPI000A191FB9|nr:multidrug efflux SMR transporter [Neisseria animaloris]OSI06759.1 QacE family quaternary ammonium compound efflux SMR transporter [Neisseria animaloris]VEH86865.1 putative small multidrug resistance protein [Neisseria animaloris]